MAGPLSARLLKIRTRPHRRSGRSEEDRGGHVHGGGCWGVSSCLCSSHSKHASRGPLFWPWKPLVHPIRSKGDEGNPQHPSGEDAARSHMLGKAKQSSSPYSKERG